MMKDTNIVVILNNIRSNENVGSIFRTADATGVSKIFLVGYTPAPTDRFGRENKGLTKASLGAEKSVEWEKVGTLEEVIQKLRDFPPAHTSEGTDIFLLKNSSSSFQSNSLAPHKHVPAENYTVVGIEQSSKSIDYKLLSKDCNLALVFGNEVEGLSKEDLALCDMVAEIPMKGQKESLNVAVSVGVVLYSLV